MRRVLRHLQLMLAVAKLWLVSAAEISGLSLFVVARTGRENDPKSLGVLFSFNFNRIAGQFVRRGYSGSTKRAGLEFGCAM